MSFQRYNQLLVLEGRDFVDYSFLLGRQLLTSAGAALLWPTFFAARHLIFGLADGDRQELNEKPYISKIQQLKHAPAGELVNMSTGKIGEASHGLDRSSLDQPDDCVA